MEERVNVNKEKKRLKGIRVRRLQRPTNEKCGLMIIFQEKVGLRKSPWLANVLRYTVETGHGLALQGPTVRIIMGFGTVEHLCSMIHRYSSFCHWLLL